jgi:AcrR family transcriptional regulator
MSLNGIIIPILPTNSRHIPAGRMGMKPLQGSDLSTPSNRKDANQNTLKVLKAAYKAFALKGYEATIEEIASEAGVGVGTVHRRFSNKTVLAVAVVTDIFQEIKEKQMQAVEMILPADQKIRLLFDIFSVSHLQYGKIHSMGLHLATLGELGDEMKTSLLSSLQGCLLEIIIQGQKEGIFRLGDPKLMELLIIHMINPNLIIQLKDYVSLEQITESVADMILLGLQKK